MNDTALEEAEENYREQRQLLACQEAALLVVGGTSREQAIRIVKERNAQRDEATTTGAFVQDAEGNIESFIDPELDIDPLSVTNPAQVKAIAAELFAADAFGDEA